MNDIRDDCPDFIIGILTGNYISNKTNNSHVYKENNQFYRKLREITEII